MSLFPFSNATPCDNKCEQLRMYSFSSLFLLKQIWIYTSICSYIMVCYSYWISIVLHILPGDVIFLPSNLSGIFLMCKCEFVCVRVCDCISFSSFCFCAYTILVEWIQQKCWNKYLWFYRFWYWFGLILCFCICFLYFCFPIFSPCLSQTTLFKLNTSDE